MKYIDVSQWQGEIDWETAKPHIDGAILRAGYGQGHIDPQFNRNAAECNRLGIPCGAYWFSYAWTPEMAKQEAQYLLEAVKPYRMELPLAFDFEGDSVKNAEKKGVTITKAMATAMAYAFCETIEAGGYWALVYANPDYLKRYYAENLPQRFGLWLAAWPNTVNVNNPPRSDCVIWQWGGSAVPGITPGKDVDTNEAYTDFATVIRAAGMNHLPKEPDTTTGAANEQQPIDQTQYAMTWAKSEGLVPDYVEAAMPLTWGDLALLMFRANGPEDDKPLGGLISD